LGRRGKEPAQAADDSRQCAQAHAQQDPERQTHLANDLDQIGIVDEVEGVAESVFGIQLGFFVFLIIVIIIINIIVF